MPKCLLAAALFSTLAVSASAQDAKPADPAPLQLTAQQDHKLMMEALKIDSLRRGADGRNRNAPNAANYDESAAMEPVLVARCRWLIDHPEVVRGAVGFHRAVAING